MVRKLIRESEFSGVVREGLSASYDVIRVETRLEDGWSDLLAIRKSDGSACFLELKQIDHFTKAGCVFIDLDPIQAIFLRARAAACDHVGSAVMIRVGDGDIYTFPARRETEWCKWIRSQIYPDQLSPPLCFKHRASGLKVAVEQAYNARFTLAPLPPPLRT